MTDLDAGRGTVVGTARVGRRTKELAKRLSAGEVAFIDHRDLDRVAGESLVATGVSAVVNASEFISGRYPNSGPQRLDEAGIVLVDHAGAEVMDLVTDGSEVTLEGGRILLEGTEVARGEVIARDEISERMEHARESIGAELRTFAVNTLEYIDKEADLAFEPLVVPPLRTEFEGRHVLVVVRGHDYKDDLRALRAYIHEYHPVLVAVDGGADALLEVNLVPDMIIGDFDSLSANAWECGAELVHHVHPDGRAPGREELQEAGKPYVEFVVEGTSEDAAMLLAYECRAELIVAVGTHATMVEFLDKGRAGMSSTFLTRLRLGPMLIDAKGVSQLYKGRVRRRDLLLLVVAAIVVILAVALVSDSLQLLLRTVWLDVRDFWYSITGRLS
ncbi:MAG: putative cytokinetic ring protein SteA [Microthrixaceae bacterium]